MLPLLAAALAGSPAPVDWREVQRVGDGHARDRVPVWGGAGLDLASTGWALHRCGSCREANGALPSVEVRVGAKVLAAVAADYACYRLRRRGKHGWATALSVGAATVAVAASAVNVRRAIRGE